MELIAQVCEDIKPNILKVEIKEMSSGKELSSVDDLYCFEPAFGMIAELGMKFIQGFAEKN
jgi:hypothetical protein